MSKQNAVQLFCNSTPIYIWNSTPIYFWNSTPGWSAAAKRQDVLLQRILLHRRINDVPNLRVVSKGWLLAFWDCIRRLHRSSQIRLQSQAISQGNQQLDYGEDCGKDWGEDCGGWRCTYTPSPPIRAELLFQLHRRTWIWIQQLAG